MFSWTFIIIRKNILNFDSSLNTILSDFCVMIILLQSDDKASSWENWTKREQNSLFQESLKTLTKKKTNLANDDEGTT